jgi:hypothetical protein
MKWHTVDWWSHLTSSTMLQVQLTIFHEPQIAEIYRFLQDSGIAKVFRRFRSGNLDRPDFFGTSSESRDMVEA